MHSYSKSLYTIAMICSLSWGLSFSPTFSKKVVLIDPLIRLDQMGGRRTDLIDFPIVDSNDYTNL